MKYENLSTITVNNEESKTIINFDGVTGAPPNPKNYRITVRINEITEEGHEIEGPVKSFYIGDYTEAANNYKNLINDNI